MRHQLYTSTSTPRLYPGEINLRRELYNMYHGSPQEIKKAHPLLLRRARRDENNKLIPCSCVDPLTREPDKDHRCDYCYQQGYMWDEEWVYARKTFIRSSNTSDVGVDYYLDAGLLRVLGVIYYFEYDLDITDIDRIVEVALDTEGVPVLPYRRTVVYKPSIVMDLRSDEGRIEFYAIPCAQEDAVKIQEEL